MSGMRSRAARWSAGGIAAALVSIALSGTAAAQSTCAVNLRPSVVAVGQQFTVSGNFGGAEIFLVRGANARPSETAAPAATTPPGTSFSVKFTAQRGDEGTWTVWGILRATECGAFATLTVTGGSLPDAAMSSNPGPAAALGMMLLALSGLSALGVVGVGIARRRAASRPARDRVRRVAPAR